MDQVQAMDRMYRYQKYIYDFTRKYYLLGRDTLIRRMDIKPDENVLEVGCGTARNLLLIAKRYPQAKLYGLDASTEMLDTAATKIRSTPYADRITLTHCLAEDLHHQRTFGVEKPFDKVFFSYSLSMIPPWLQALHVGLENLKSGGILYIVDFSDQRGLPKWFSFMLKRWLAMFGVHYHPELLVELQKLHDSGQGTLQITSLGGHYAFIAEFVKK
jgi:S-adenosylmethionine-diacylgycerolhomoserine-N-methlytransferase